MSKLIQRTVVSVELHVVRDRFVTMVYVLSYAKSVKLIVQVNVSTSKAIQKTVESVLKHVLLDKHALLEYANLHVLQVKVIVPINALISRLMSIIVAVAG